MVVKIDTKDYGLLEHLYWKEVLSMQSKDSESILKIISGKSKETRETFLDYIVQGYYPFSSLAPHFFKRAEELTSGDSHELAQRLYEVEVGEHPFIKGTQYDGMPHSEQFRLLIESLGDGFNIESPYRKAQELAQNLGIKEASLDEVLAYIIVNENSAPEIVNTLGDFVAQWQVHNGRTSSYIKKNFLLEHGLTEGSETKEQHISVVEKIAGPYKDRIKTDVFDSAVKRLIRLHHEQLDAVYKELMKLVNS